MQLAVIVTMSAVGMVQMAIYQVVDMISMGDGLMAAGRAMSVCLLMSGAIVAWSASFGIRRIYLDTVVLYRIAVLMMQMTIVKVVRVTIVLHRYMAAVRAMLVGMTTGMVLVSFRHRQILSSMRPASARIDAPH